MAANAHAAHAASHPSALSVADRSAAQASYSAVRALSEGLAEPLAPEDQVVQSMPDASPTKWHLAHVTWFFETFLLQPNLSGYEPFDPDYRYLFNSYYETVGERYPRTERGMLTRPLVSEVRDYRHHVDDAMARLIAEAGGKTWEEIAPLLELGLHHEQQHQELLLTDIKHLFSCNALFPAYGRGRPGEANAAPPLSWHGYDGGVMEIGHDGTGFAFDCEGPRHKAYLEPYRLASRPATNGELLDFVEDGGYQEFSHWLSQGWATVQAEGWRHPMYWRERDGEWFEFTLGGLQPLDREAPACHLSYIEADAYAHWAGKRLPTETEWEIAGRALPAEGNLLPAGHLHPVAAKSSPEAPVQMYGDVWEWTSSTYGPYPGFRPSAGAISEYNGKFMCGQYVLRGGSCATPAGHVRATYRNFFYPSDRWQFTGVRLADDA